MRLFLAAVVASSAFLIACAADAFTNSSAVPPTKLGTSVRATGANQVKPAQCAALTLTTVVNAAGTYTAPNGVNGLLLGSGAGDWITGRSGSECLVGGGGNDILNGGSGTDVCIGGPGNDVFLGCETQIQ
jgi:Ca2+-binding RTX toxin-like protein